MDIEMENKLGFEYFEGEFNPDYLEGTPVEIIENFHLDEIRYDENEEYDIKYAREYESEQSKKSSLSPRYMAESPELNALARVILDDAIRFEATDIQISQLTTKIGLVRLRIGEGMHAHRRIHGSAMKSLVIVFKFLAGADIDDEKSEQNGRISYEYEGSRYNIRASFMPTMASNTVSLRVLYDESLKSDVSQLGFPPVVENTLLQVLNLTEGLILLTGGTGSGKTTTMYTSIQHIQEMNDYQKNVITIEDPVEYVIPGAVQSPVDDLVGYTFAVGLKTALRQNPDIILVGEINNPETADTAIRAATTGHLVFSTFHSESVLSVPLAMNHYGVPMINLNRALTLVLHQSLPEKLCPHCKKTRVVDTANMQWLKKLNPEEELLIVYQRQGCEKCNNIGVLGRVLCVSMLDANSVYSDIVLETDVPSEIEKKLMKTDGANYYPKALDVHRHLKEGNIDLITAKRLMR